MDREPGLRRILGDTGGAFAMGALGGSVYHFVKGLRNSPNGTRIAGGLEAARLNVPRIAGSFAVWGGLFSACDCAFVYVRKKEDPWSSILSGAATSGILSVRQGLHAVVRSPVQGSVILALLTGPGLSAQRRSQSSSISMPVDSPMIIPVEKNTHDELSSGLFGERKVQDGATNSSCKNDAFGTSDVSHVSMPSSEYK